MIVLALCGRLKQMKIRHVGLLTPKSRLFKQKEDQFKEEIPKGPLSDQSLIKRTYLAARNLPSGVDSVKIIHQQKNILHSHILFLAAQSSSRSLFVGPSFGHLCEKEHQMVTKTYLSCNLCDSSDGRDSSKSNEGCDSSDNSAHKFFFPKKTFFFYNKNSLFQQQKTFRQQIYTKKNLNQKHKKN